MPSPLSPLFFGFLGKLIEIKELPFFIKF